MKLPPILYSPISYKDQVFPVIIQVSNMKKLFDLPEARKIHANPIPSLGGLGIFAGFTVGLLLMVNLKDPEATNTFQFYLTSFLVIFFFGIKDDILILTPFKKLLGQMAVAAIRILHGRSPFSPHRNHVHHLLQKGFYQFKPYRSSQAKAADHD